MIQRIQTIYLLVAVISGILQFIFPIAIYPNPVQGQFSLSVIGMQYVETGTYVNIVSTIPMAILVALSIMLSFIAIFMYKKRMKQLLVVNSAFMLNVIMIALMFLLYSNHLFRDIVKIEPTYRIGSFLPVVSVVFLVLASSAIKKDEALVKSADRLR